MSIICIILLIVVLALVWGVSTTAKKLRACEKKCEAQDEELNKLRWENAQLRERHPDAGYSDHGGYPGH